MPTTITHGVSSIGSGIGDFLDKFSFKKAVEHSERRSTAGVFTKVKTFNPTNSFDFEGGGDLSIAVGTGSLTITGMSGGVHLVLGSDKEEQNADFDMSRVNGKHYPSGAVV